MRLAHPLILCLLLGLGIPASANQAPVAVDDSYSVLHDQTLSVSPPVSWPTTPTRTAIPFTSPRSLPTPSMAR